MVERRTGFADAMNRLQKTMAKSTGSLRSNASNGVTDF
jgi:hypothetical protein